MKRNQRINFRIGSLIVIGLLISAVPITGANAAVKAGSICTKLNSSTSSAGARYICVKSGKKLVWKAASVQPAAPTSFDNLVANYKGISYAAWNSASTAIKSSTAVSPAYKSITGPNTKLIIKNPATVFDLIARMYTGYTSSKDFSVIAYGYEDRDWAQAQLKSLQPNSFYTWVTDTGCVTRETCWGGSVFTDDSGNQVLITTTEVADENHTSGTLQAHEYTHVVQQNQMRRPQPWPPNDSYPPVWLHEGGAQFSQNAAIYYQSFEKYSLSRREASENIFRDSKITSDWIQEYLEPSPGLAWIKKYDRWTMFVMGAMVVEILVALKGPEPTMEIWKLCGTGMKFSDAFEKVYGISYEKALPTISKAIALELGRS